MEVEDQLDVRFRSFGEVGGPKRGIDENRRRSCSSDVGADLSVASCRSLASSRQVWGSCHRQQRHRELR